MKESIYKKEKKQKEITMALAFYKEGFTTREVAEMLKKSGISRSHSWVAYMVERHLSPSVTK